MKTAGNTVSETDPDAGVFPVHPRIEGIVHEQVSQHR